MTVSDYLERLMRRRLRFAGAVVTALPEGFRGPVDVPATPRLLLVRSGVVAFQIEERRVEMPAGSMVLIVPWSRRQWRGPAGTEVSWCHFDADEPPHDVPAEAVIGQVRDLALEAASFERLRDASRRNPSREAALEVEGEIKAILGRFASVLEETASSTPHSRRTAGDAGVARATEWLAGHYAQRDALSLLPDVAELSAKHFRECFRRRTGMSPRRYLTTLRMRTARFYLLESGMQVKQIAAAVGYDDALYFSKLYHTFWGKSPSDDAGKRDS